ncbi:MAG: quinolinate phosphoribosyl transferase [Chloroflexia bacterium]|nr:quinolinate phosphoribosyl transferase [Chloroflexia bacterium]
MRKRLDPAILNLPVEKMRVGYYADQDLSRAQQVLLREDRHPRVLMVVYQRQAVVVGGTDEAIAILKLCSGHPGEGGDWVEGWEQLRVQSLYDGERATPYEPVMTIEGDYALFAQLETDFLGVLARRTRVATNTAAVVEAAGGKPVLFFPARFDHHLVQTGDGYAAYISGALGVGTDAQGAWWGRPGLATVPASLIACYGGDTVRAALQFEAHLEPEVDLIVSVDFDNDCVGAALAVARRMERRLWGVRLGTDETMVDRSLLEQMGQFKPTGVNPQLVRNVRQALDEAGFAFIRIVVAGDFSPKRIRAFEQAGVPVDAYAVGRSLLRGRLAYYADIVEVDGAPCARAGVHYEPNDRLSVVE